MRAVTIQRAFQNPAREQQAVFRTVMEAMSKPGRILRLEAGFTPPAPLGAAAAAILLTLADFETPIWLDGDLSRDAAVTAFLRFHTGARIVASPNMAVFALAGDSRNAPPPAAFAQGTPGYPDLSTTVIYQVEELQSRGWRLAGPGINGEIAFGAFPLPADFGAQLASNRSGCPLRVDMIFAGRNEVVALPRSARLVEPS